MTSSVTITRQNLLHRSSITYIRRKITGYETCYNKIYHQSSQAILLQNCGPINISEPHDRSHYFPKLTN